MPTCPHCIIKHWKPICKVNLSWEPIEKGKVEFSEYKDNIFVEVIAYHETNPSIPPSAMYKQKFIQILELTDGIIPGPDSLSAFLASDPDSNVCLHDHGHIISTIPNSQCNPLPLWLSNPTYISLLFGWDPAAHDRCRSEPQSEKCELRLLVFNCECECRPVYNQSESLYLWELSLLKI